MKESMIVAVDKTNLPQAATVHSISWKESHCSFCAPDRQKMGCGTQLLEFAVSQCTGVPTLWILENNTDAKRLYHKMGFLETGRLHTLANGLVFLVNIFECWDKRDCVPDRGYPSNEICRYS